MKAKEVQTNLKQAKNVRPTINEENIKKSILQCRNLKSRVRKTYRSKQKMSRKVFA